MTTREHSFELTAEDMARIAVEQNQLAEITRLLEEAYHHNHSHPSNGHWKSSEGHLQVHYGNYWDRKDLPCLTITQVEIYSYTFDLDDGGRRHFFPSVAQALEAVRQMHAEEMATDWDAWNEDW